ncbi:FAD-binding oxidoreductase [Geodermatophilus sabuli]|uniref:Ferredoxin-NADP reductase n=1 Tax=Geodermatophilus sabuli TaxID=1564158 RepID=A0A285EKU2_9ACTN|nr:FAD-binding oxidoreductase [Geodermatophilus sabuli]MBB3086842.1 ferredoxin-NADP reductase [Geodermatophilus sabuli]SNX98784.1 Ferredoxin-NADP reductase [Geodermatophilus sabuli]
MAGTALQRRLTWLTAQVRDNRSESPSVHRLVLDVPGWPGHRAGQHVVVRLTAEDGYTAQRSYSLASPPEEPDLHLLVARLDGGEVSPYLTDELRADDQVELRGPIGGFFVWSAAADRRDAQEGRRPVQLVAGGSGVAPFAAMLDHHRRTGSPTRLRLLYSASTQEEILARDVLGPETTVTLTRGVPAGWSGEAGRIDADMLRRRTFPPDEDPRIFVCGATMFAEAVSSSLLDLGHSPSSIRIERYGSSGEPS